MERLLKIDIEKAFIQSKYTRDEFQAGMNVLVYGHPDKLAARKVFAQLCELGINSVAITFPFYQEGWQASEVRADTVITPTITELQQLIDEAHKVGLSTMLRPILDEESLMKEKRWRGQIEPPDAEKWFQSYELFLMPYVELAHSMNVKAFNIGTEFNSLQNRYDDKWIDLIQTIRKQYDGELLYSFNWDSVSHIATNDFIEHLDHVGLDAYFPLNQPDHASVEELYEEWNKIIEELDRVLNDHSIVITEAGVVPVTGAHRTPYAWVIPNAKKDDQTQAHYYEATYRAWKPMIEGLYWWTVTLEESPDEIDYSPLRDETESVIKKHFLKIDGENR